ncbi:MAG: hypothetical protein WC809_18395 [Sinimarinibacterium sp.]|jgi:hypothetical protein
MKRTVLASALLAAGTQAAVAGDTAVVEPGLRFAWSFGAATSESRPTLSLGLYPNDLGWRRLWADAGVEEATRLERPAVLDLRVGSDAGLHLMGLPLNAHALGLNADDGESSGGSFLKPVLIVLAAGAATALVIGASGDAAEDNDPPITPTGPGEGGVFCDGTTGQCVLPCDGAGPLISCNDGG